MQPFASRVRGVVAVPLTVALLSSLWAQAADTPDAAPQTANEQRSRVGEFVDDAWITTKIKALLLKEDALGALKIDVDTKDGKVRLSGEVKKSEQVARAVEIASRVSGVKSVQVDLLLTK